MRRPDWVLAVSLFVVAVMTSVILFLDTWRVLLGTWTGIATYGYGLIVPFLSLYLIVRMRSRLKILIPSPSLWGVVAVVLVSLIWAIGDLAGVLAIQQFAVLALIPATGLAIFGTKVFKVAAFPFLFVLLALPVGEFLIPQLIDWTADFTVVALEALGIPVFRDGPFIRIPAGDFHVVKACSGVRYLLTSLVLGTLFAYLEFRSWQRRAAFLMVCVIVPIVANWLRATGIILIGHLSGMKLAGGVDHFIYGWVFFGFVMLIIFMIGARFTDRDRKKTDPPAVVGGTSDSQPLRTVSFVTAFFGVMLAASLGVVVSATLSERAAANVVQRQLIVLPSAVSGWARQETLTVDWKPVFVGARLLRTAEYQNANSRVAVTAVYYDVQSEGAELIGAQNSLYEPVIWWKRSDKKSVYNSDDKALRLTVREVSVSNGDRNRLIWTWYSISGAELSSEYRAKLATFWASAGGDGSGAYLVALAADYDQDAGAARRSLEKFLDEYLQKFRRCLDAPVNDVGGGCD